MRLRGEVERLGWRNFYICGRDEFIKDRVWDGGGGGEEEEEIEEEEEEDEVVVVVVEEEEEE